MHTQPNVKPLEFEGQAAADWWRRNSFFFKFFFVSLRVPSWIFFVLRAPSWINPRLVSDKPAPRPPRRGGSYEEKQLIIN